MTINPGEFNTKITIQKYTATTDKEGNHKQDWTDWKKPWAKVTSLYGEEYWQAAAAGQQDTLVITLRWTKDLDALAASKELTQYRLLYKNQPFDIVHFDNVDGKNRLIKLKAVSK